MMRLNEAILKMMPAYLNPIAKKKVQKTDAPGSDKKDVTKHIGIFNMPSFLNSLFFPE